MDKYEQEELETIRSFKFPPGLLRFFRDARNADFQDVCIYVLLFQFVKSSEHHDDIVDWGHYPHEAAKAKISRKRETTHLLKLRLQ